MPSAPLDPVFTVRCPQGHAIAEVVRVNGANLVRLRVSVPELGPRSSVLVTGKTSWAVLGDLDAEADDHTTTFAPCECGRSSLNVRWMRDEMRACTSRKRQTVIDPARYTADDYTAPAPYYSVLGVAPFTNVTT